METVENLTAQYEINDISLLIANIENELHRITTELALESLTSEQKAERGHCASKLELPNEI